MVRISLIVSFAHATTDIPEIKAYEASGVCALRMTAFTLDYMTMAHHFSTPPRALYHVPRKVKQITFASTATCMVSYRLILSFKGKEANKVSCCKHIQ